MYERQILSQMIEHIDRHSLPRMVQYRSLQALVIYVIGFQGPKTYLTSAHWPSCIFFEERSQFKIVAAEMHYLSMIYYTTIPRRGGE